MTTDPTDPAYREPDADGLTGSQRYERYLERCADAAGAVELVLDDPFLGGYEPQRKALAEALMWLEFNTTCGDCKEGRCHWGGSEVPETQASIAAAATGREYEHPRFGRCGCDRHGESVRVRARDARWAQATAVEKGAQG